MNSHNLHQTAAIHFWLLSCKYERKQLTKAEVKKISRCKKGKEIINEISPNFSLKELFCLALDSADNFQFKTDGWMILKKGRVVREINDRSKVFKAKWS